MLKAYIRKESAGQQLSIDRDGYSQLVAANHVLILLRVVARAFCAGSNRSYFFLRELAECLIQQCDYRSGSFARRNLS